MFQDNELTALVNSYGKSLESVMMKSLNHAISGSCLVEFTEKAHALRHLVYFGVIDVSTVEQVLTKKVSRCANPQILVENLKFGLTVFFLGFYSVSNDFVHCL